MEQKLTACTPDLRDCRSWIDGARSLFLKASTGRWLAVEGGGARILELCDGQRSWQDIVEVLLNEFSVKRSVAQDDVRLFAAVLEESDFPNQRAPSQGVPALRGLALQVTARCPLNCRHCYGEAGPKTHDEPEPEQLADLVRQARELGASSFHITGGEAMLRPDALQAIGEVASGCRVTLLTSGMVGPPQVLAELMQKWDWQVQLSLDGSCSAIHDWYRGEGAFYRLISTVRFLVNNGFGERIRLCTCLSGVNRHDIAAVVALAEEIGVAGVHLVPISPQGRAAQNWHSLAMSPCQWEETCSELAGIYLQHSHTLRLSGFIVDGLLGCAVGNEGHHCRPGANLSVDCSGNVYPCTMLGQPAHCLGNTTTHSLADCLDSAVLQRVCDQIAARLEDESVCGGCDWRQVCRGACPGRVMVNRGTFSATDELCNLRRRLFPELLLNLSEWLEKRTASGGCLQ